MRLVEGHAAVEDVDAFVDRLRTIGAEHGCAVTAVDARYVAGRDHLVAAVDRANRAFARGEAIADDRAIEVLLYAAGRRQIERAIEMGVSEGDAPVVVVVDSEAGDDPAEAAAVEAVEALLEPAAVLGDAREEARICEFFDVTDAELGATDADLEALVIERVSLLALET